MTAASLSWAQDWTPLFDGKTLDGWKAAENPGSFKVIDGQIACDGPRAHLFYVGPDGKADFKNFELIFEVRTVPGANSGFYFHTAFQAQDWPGKGFEVQVHNSRSGEGSYRENKLTGSLYGVRNVYKRLVRDGEWCTLRVLVEGKRVRTFLGDLQLVDYVESEPPTTHPDYPGRVLDRGTFAIQCHDPASKVFYKNIRVRRLPDDLPDGVAAAPPPTAYEQQLLKLGGANVPLVNYHVHLKGGLTLDQALAESRRTGVFYGIAVNCGLNFSVTNDAGINDYLAAMKGQPVFVAMQAEGREWVRLFSPQAVARFDYVFTDSMTIFDDAGRRMRLWINEEVPEITDTQAFMDMLVNRTVRILRTEPIDIYVNPTFLPSQIAADYDRLWTEDRMKQVIGAAVDRGIAIEINSRYRLPSPAFLKLAKAAGCKFAFGTNNGDRDIGKLDYCLEVTRELGLQWSDIWVPSKDRP